MPPAKSLLDTPPPGHRPVHTYTRYGHNKGALFVVQTAINLPIIPVTKVMRIAVFRAKNEDPFLGNELLPEKGVL